MVDRPAPDALYIRLAVTDLQIDKKKCNLLAYTPVGFVVEVGVKALQGLMDKYDVLDMALQIECQDSVTQAVLAAGVIERGKSADAKKAISFDMMAAATNEFAERCACRLDNGHVMAAQRIDCTDPVARKARPKVVSL
jgi:hypothetical protein